MVESDQNMPEVPPAVAALPFVRVLLVDDQAIIGEAVRRMVSTEADIQFLAVLDARQALPTALEWKPTVILQDLVMHDTDGFEVVQQFRANPATRDIPIIMLSSKEDAHTKAQGFSAGANDYLVKLPAPLELLARLRYHSSAYRSRLERDAAFHALRESERMLAELNVRLQRLAELDGLTGIANRRRFDEVLASEWQRAQRTRRPLSLLLCDIDYFKLYNDTHGHLAGDQCLKKVAEILAGNLRRPADLAARYGGEEFALILPETDADGAVAVGEACRRQLEALSLPNQPAPPGRIVTLSVGAASVVPVAGSNPATLVDIADRALYDAKDRGRNQTARRG
ncbi:MAG TPA: diguanylate cyclase [Noviherbaspirillum sp.]|uniref:diguanylate cyclase domain-containing protein n=1 Tax=Noviherbaspirillum sp. TaxID=1926288 RepID=UPI002D3ACDB6|nr:diguanylate cyclase [Noviherbaspirillum sp.]HYD97566.1 diguanylate cyclase [Noviherbaspirillum sp.]